jgi:5'-nucleotidase
MEATSPGLGVGAVSYRRVRILVTNDDGVHAPGLAALTRALAAWAAADPTSEDRQVFVVAPKVNHSGAGAAVGTVYEREAIDWTAARIEGAEHVPAFGIDGSPALSVILAALGGFGPRPDLVCSGINLGVNVGRSILHSGTVGACLTGAQLGLSGLAVSLRSGGETDHWDTAAGLAVALLDPLAAAPARTVFNLNVPSVAPDELKGLRRGRVSTAGIIKAAIDSRHPAEGPSWPPPPGAEEGQVRLQLGAAVPRLGVPDGPGGPGGADAEASLDDPLALHDGPGQSDALLVAQGWASLTPVHGVREDTGPEVSALLDRCQWSAPRR